jgi:hypothetical protein
MERHELDGDISRPSGEVSNEPKRLHRTMRVPQRNENRLRVRGSFQVLTLKPERFIERAEGDLYHDALDTYRSTPVPTSESGRLQMARKWVFGMAASLGALTAVGVQAAPALASSAVVPNSTSAIVGVLGYEGGGPSTKFHPTSGTVEVEFTNPPLVLLKKVGDSGHFRIGLQPGSYTVIGCGPSSSGGSPLCGQPQNITLKAGEVDHIRLIWAYVP